MDTWLLDLSKKKHDKKKNVWQPLRVYVYAFMYLRLTTTSTEMLISSWAILASLAPSQKRRTVYTQVDNPCAS